LNSTLWLYCKTYFRYAATQLNGYAEQHRLGTSQNPSPRVTTPSSPSSFSKYPTFHSHTSDGDADYTTNEEGYEVIFKPEKLDIELGPRRKTFRGQPLSQEQWLNYLDNEGRITNLEEIKQIVFRGVRRNCSFCAGRTGRVH